MLQKSIRVLHFTDYHGYLEGQNGWGGLAYLKAAATEAKKVDSNTKVFTLYGGDLIGQHPLSKRFAYKPDIEILKTMQLNAFALGNHDFDDGPAVLGKIIDSFNQNVEQKTAFVCANIDVTNEPELAGKVVPYVVEGDVAIVGLITLETEKGSNAGKNVAFHDPFVTAQNIIKELQGKQIKKIIFLSHLGFTEDQKLAKLLKPYGIDFVILGGHTHTLLGNNLDPALGESQGDYPIVVKHEDGKHKTLLTSASYHGKVLGQLDLTYNEAGEIEKYSENSVIPIDQTKIVPDKEAVAVIEKYKTELLASDKKYFDVIAHSNVYMIGLDSFEENGLKKLEDISRLEKSIPCTLAATAQYDYFKEVLQQNVDGALFHAGGFRTDIAPGPIYRWQLYQAHPFEKQTLVTVKLTPAELKLILEEGLKELGTSVLSDLERIRKEGVRGVGQYHRNAQMLHGSLGFTYEFECIEGQLPTVKNIQLNGKEIEGNVTVVVNRFMIGDPSKEEQKQPYPTLFRIAKQQGLHAAAEKGPRDLEALIYECEQKRPIIGESLLQGIESNVPSLREVYGCDADIHPKEKVSARNLLVPVPTTNKQEELDNVSVDSSATYTNVLVPTANTNVAASSTPQVAATTPQVKLLINQ